MPQHGGKREGSGRTPLPESEKKIAKTIYITPTLQSDIDRFATGNSFSEKCIDLISTQVARRKRTLDKTVKFIDLFAGLGGIRLGFENAFRENGLILFAYSVAKLRITLLKHIRTTLTTKR